MIGCTVELEKSTVLHGESVSFSIVANFGYNIENAVIYVNSQEILPNNNLYTISNINSYINITIENIELLQFNISSINGISLNIVDELEYYTVFDTIQFTYNIDVGYEELENFALTTNSGVLSNNNDIYSLSGFTNDIEMGAEGLGVIGCRLIYDSDLFTINITNPKEKYFIGDEIVFTIMPNIE